MRNKERTHRPLAELAERQHGVVSIRQLEAIGYRRPAITRATRSGRLHRIHRGVYAVGHANLTWDGRCLAAVLACAPNAVASHGSAAWLWGLLTSRPGTFHVTAPTRRHPKPKLCVHFGRLTGEDRAVCNGIPVTSVPRTLLDCAAMSTDTRLERALERSEERDLFDLRAVEALLARAGNHPGAGHLRRALAIYRDDPAFTRSKLERRFHDLVRRSGLPVPAANFWVGGYEVDAYWPAERFGVELDVYETHGTRAAFERDRLRQENLKLQDIETIRITGPRLDREPTEVIERIATLLEQRRRNPPAGRLRGSGRFRRDGSDC
jgi:predicted transcriptional regulator of viral defense system/very-short-patch-repair endonuclease